MAVDCDERLLTLFAELDEARRELATALKDYPHALKRWADTVKATGNRTIDMVDALLSTRGVGDMTETQVLQVIRRSDHGVNVDSAWNALNAAADAYYKAMAKLTVRQKAVMGYMAYLDNMEEQIEKHHVPELLAGAMERNAPEGWHIPLEPPVTTVNVKMPPKKTS